MSLANSTTKNASNTVNNHTCMRTYDFGVQADQILIYQAWVVWKMDNSIHWIDHYPADNMDYFQLLTLIRWIGIYPVDSTIQFLND